MKKNIYNEYYKSKKMKRYHINKKQKIYEN